MATTSNTLNAPAGGTATQSLADWVAPYVGNMLGQAYAISNQPYQVYQGPTVADTSQIQKNVFSGLGSLTVPQTMGQSFTSEGTMAVPQATTAGPLQDVSAGTGIAAQYMNPYLQSVLQPQLAEMRRQAQINLQPSMAKLTQAGGYGGSREALMRTESDRNLLDAMTGAIGKGYASAFDTGRQQFNTEQGQAKDLVNMLSQAGAQQRAIEQEGLTADYNEFLAQRDYPMRNVQFLQSMLQGLPVGKVTSTAPELSTAGKIQEAIGTAGTAYEFLKKLGVIS